MNRTACALLLGCLCLPGCLVSRVGGEPSGPPASPNLADLPKGAKLVWLGDSLTSQPGYTDRVEQHFATQHPHRGLRFINLARRGDTAGDALDRFEQEVAPLAPDALLVMLGMNDAGHLGLRRDLLRIYLDRMAELEALVRRRTHARLVLITPTCVLPGAYNQDQKNRMLAAMAQGLEDLALERGVALARIHGPFCQALRRAEGNDLMSDPEHPSEQGHAALANILLGMIDPESQANL